jgi:hypothetical protein
MKLFSWGLRSSSRLLIFETGLMAGLSLKHISSVFFCSFTMLAMSACAPSRAPDDVFDIGNISKPQWQRMQNECDYEAQKAVASQKLGRVWYLDWRDLYLKCLALRGARHIGTTDDFPDV